MLSDANVHFKSLVIVVSWVILLGCAIVCVHVMCVLAACCGSITRTLETSSSHGIWSRLTNCFWS